HRVPPGHEEGDGERVPVRRERNQGSRSGETQRCRDRPLGVVPGWTASAAHAQGGYRLRLGHVAYDVRDDRREGVDLQGRDGQDEKPPETDVKDNGQRTTNHDDAEEGEVQKTAARTAPRAGHARAEDLVRRLRITGA